MFDMNDTDLIIKLISARSSDEIITPICVKIGNLYYSLLEIDKIQDCSPSIFKICFGSSDSVFVKKRFPRDRLFDFNAIKVFKQFDDDKQCLIEYITFESSDMIGDDSPLATEINHWYNILLNYAMEKASINKKERIRKTMEELS